MPASVLLAALIAPGPAQSAEVVTVGYQEYRPLLWTGEDHRPAGFVEQVLDEAARREHITLRWVPASGQTLDILRRNEAQIWPVYPGGVTDRRGLHISSPWWRTEFSIVVAADNAILRAADWTGTVAVADSQTTLEAVRTLSVATPKQYTSAATATEGFCRGETGALLLGYFRAQQLLSDRPAVCRDKTLRVLMLPEAGNDLSIVSTKDAAGIADRLRGRIDDMAIDGTLLRVAMQYPGIIHGMAVHLARLADANANHQRVEREVTALIVVVLLTGVLLLRLFLDRRKRLGVEAALRASEDRLRLALVAANMTPWDWEEARAFITDPGEYKRIEAEVITALQRGSACEFEYRAATAGGDERWILVKAHAAPLRDRLTGIALDITARKRAEIARAEIEERFRRAVLESPVPMMIYAEDGEVLNLSRSWTTLTGYTIHDIPSLRLWNELALQKPAGPPEAGEAQVITKEGTIRTWLLSKSGLGSLADGRPLALLAASDLTARKQAEQQLRNANFELEQYAYAASHDLQEPMRVIGLYSQMLLRKHGTEFSLQAQSYFDMISKEADRMTGIVKGLVSYSRLVCETEEIPLQPVQLQAVVSDVMSDLRILITERSARISVAPLPPVLGDPQLLAAALRHLLSNAITYVAQGADPDIHIFAGRHEDEWVISVRDNGVGIEAEYHERIWGVFKRLHGREIPGTGIGLAVVRKVIQQHGGRAWVESSGAGSGSTFRFTLRALEAGVPAVSLPGAAVTRI